MIPLAYTRRALKPTDHTLLKISMTPPTAEQIERLARARCVVEGLDPDERVNGPSIYGGRFRGLRYQMHLNAARDRLVMDAAVAQMKLEDGE